MLAKYEKAIEFGEQALQLAPSLNYVRMNLGITYLRLGELQDSLDSYASILDYRPDRTEYEGGIRDLQELLREFPGQYPSDTFYSAISFSCRETILLPKKPMNATFKKAPFLIGKHKLGIG